MMRAPTRRRQRGVALITAVLIVALGTMLAASVFFRGYLDQRLASSPSFVARFELAGRTPQPSAFGH